MFGLQQWHFLVTRPKAQAHPWMKQLQSLGATVTWQPMLEILPLEETAARQAIVDRVLMFAEYQKAIFISQNAVHYAVQWLDQYWPQLPIDTQFFAIGKATAELLDSNIGAGSSDASYLAHSAYSSMNSEALLSHPDLQHIDGQKIIIFRGEGGRNILADELRARGAVVDYCELYQRSLPNETSQALNKDYRHTSKQAVTAVHSGETLSNLCSIIQSDDLLWLQQQPLLVPGLRVAEQARMAGFQQVITAQNATHDSMIKALNER